MTSSELPKLGAAIWPRLIGAAAVDRADRGTLRMVLSRGSIKGELSEALLSLSPGMSVCRQSAWRC
jgi:hypothetical protein